MKQHILIGVERGSMKISSMSTIQDGKIDQTFLNNILKTDRIPIIIRENKHEPYKVGMIFDIQPDYHDQLKETSGLGQGSDPVGVFLESTKSGGQVSKKQFYKMRKRLNRSIDVFTRYMQKNDEHLEAAIEDISSLAAGWKIDNKVLQSLLRRIEHVETTLKTMSIKSVTSVDNIEAIAAEIKVPSQNSPNVGFPEFMNKILSDGYQPVKPKLVSIEVDPIVPLTDTKKLTAIFSDGTKAGVVFNEKPSPETFCFILSGWIDSINKAFTYKKPPTSK